jgi:hypothetical protein
MKKILISLIIWLLAIIPAQAQCAGEFCVSLPIIQTFNPCAEAGMSDWKIIIPESTINKCLNPSAEIAGNFAAAGGATVTRETTYQHYSPYSYRVQTANDNEGIELTLGTLANAIHYVTVRVRGTLPAAWDWSLDNATYTAPTLIESIDSNWSLYGLQFPAAQANGSTTLYIDQNGAGSGDFYLDGIQVEEKEYWTTYCDGTQGGCEWLGPKHAATSQRSANSRAGGRLYDLEDDYYFQIGGMSGTGTSPQDLTIDEYAVLPGGELNNTKINSRVFTLTGVINGTSRTDFHDKKQALYDALSSDAYPEDIDGPQPVRLQYHGATVHKQIAVHYESGLQGELSASDPCFWELVAVRFAAPKPDWEEIGESVTILDTNDSATFRIVAARLRSTGQWNDLGPPNAAGTYTQVFAFAEDDTYVYIAGDFLNFDNVANADYIARYNKATGVWDGISGFNGVITSLAIAPNGDLYIGGFFTNAGAIAAADYICMWDGSSLNAVGTPVAGASAITAVYDLAFDTAGNLYIVGNFTNWADIAAADYVVMWDGTSYTALGTGLDDIGRAVTVRQSDNLVFIGGDFLNAGGAGNNYCTSWNGTAFVALSSGMNGSVRSIVVNQADNKVFFGGFFTTSEGITTNRVTVWTDTSFSALGDGLDGAVYSLSLAPDSSLFVVGAFSSPTGSEGGLVIKWNGYAWAHVDIEFPAASILYAIFASQYTDPVIEEYDIWAGFDTEGTGYFGGDVTSTNEGTVPVYPKVVYNRDGGTTATIETLRNERTGKELLFDYDLLDGETLTIDLAQTKKSIVSSMFGQRQDAVLPNSDFGDWSLLQGDNDVTSFVNVTGAPTITAYMLWKDSYSSQD